MRYRGTATRGRPGSPEPRDRLDGSPLLTDGGTPHDGDPDEDLDAERAEDGPDEESGDDSAGESNVAVMDAGEAEPAEPTWEPPDLDGLPDFEIRADEPVTGGPGSTDAAEGPEPGRDTNPAATPEAPTAGMPHDAQAPGATAVSGGGTEAYVAALELCARLPDDVRLPDESPDLVPAAVEAELEQDVQQFAAAEFDNARPHVDVLAFDEVDDEVWLRLRIGIPADDFDALDPGRLREYALQRLEGVF